MGLAMKLEDFGRKLLGGVASVIAVISVFIAHSADDAARFIYRELPDSATIRKEAWDLGEKGVKKLGEEGIKQAPEMYKQYKRGNTPLTSPFQQRSSAPLSEQEKAFQKETGLNPRTLKPIPFAKSK